MEAVRDPALWFGRLLLWAIGLLPRSLSRLVTGAGGRVNAALTVPLGVLTLLVALLSTVNEVRVLFLYWWTDDVTADTWGGPTMAGAWAVHAGLGLLFLPVFLGVLAGCRRLVDRLGTARWALAATVAADAVALTFLVAFVRQL
jgi:hypothetical protein